MRELARSISELCFDVYLGSGKDAEEGRFHLTRAAVKVLASARQVSCIGSPQKSLL